MKISIAELKKDFLNNVKINRNNQSEYFYSYESKNFNLEDKLELEGYLCVHRRNYKTILVDKTDWIYIEFLNSNFKDGANLSCYHFLSHFILKSFNLFYENFAYKATKQSNKPEKCFIYIQTDLISSEIKKLSWSDIESIQIISDESRIFFLITKELVKTFGIKSSITSDDKKIEIIKKNNDEQSDFWYVFRVEKKGPVHSLANSQFKSKLRCDICIEIAPYKQTESNQSSKVIISFISKFLFYINFLHSDRAYLLKTDKELDIFENKGAPHQAEPNLNLIFFQSSFEIQELENTRDFSYFFNNKTCPKKCSMQIDFLNSMRGTLIDKKIVPSFFQTDKDLDALLINHYDLILPNKQLKLALKTSDTNETISVFFDTRFSIYPICVLPGMDIEVTDLVKKGDRVFKSNSSLKPLSTQRFNLLNPKKELSMTTSENADLRNRNISIDNLSQLDYSFCSFYESREKNHEFKIREQVLNIKLLFKNSEFCQEPCGSLVKIYGQIVKIYELSLRLKCKICSSLISSCICRSKNKEENFHLEFSTSLLVDDHSSILRLNYSSSNIDLKSNQSNFFQSISGFLHKILFNLNEIKMIPVPSHLNSCEYSSNEIDRSGKIYQILKENLIHESGQLADQMCAESNRTINNSILNSALNAQDSSYIFENVVKLDIYKTLYDYLNFTILDKHYLFYIDVSDLNNIRELEKCSDEKYRNYKYFKISDLNCNEQFKSILNLKCINFLPIEIEIAD